MAFKISDVEEYLVNYTFEESDNISLFPTGKKTIVEHLAVNDLSVPRYINEYWTARQKQSSSIHEISYRACFKAELPRFFIALLTAPGELVYDPFCGRGTTVIEAAILGRRVVANDVNPLSRILTLPRLALPAVDQVEARLEQIVTDTQARAEIDLSMFYHPETEKELVSLRQYLENRRQSGEEDVVDLWIRMVATNRLTGHSAGFFSVYTLPPNQAVSPQRQEKINQKRNQQPTYRDTRDLIKKKTRRLLNRLGARDAANLKEAAQSALFLEKDAALTQEIIGNTVALTVTSPPFLDVVQYADDNWLRCWFNCIDMEKVEKKITMAGKIGDWCAVMASVFAELYRITRPQGWVAFEVGEVKRGRINLEDHVVPLGLEAGFSCPGVLVNLQEFTKTSNIWGVNNNASGTNTNRIALFYKK